MTRQNHSNISIDFNLQPLVHRVSHTKINEWSLLSKPDHFQIKRPLDIWI